MASINRSIPVRERETKPSVCPPERKVQIFVIFSCLAAFHFTQSKLPVWYSCGPVGNLQLTARERKLPSVRNDDDDLPGSELCFRGRVETLSHVFTRSYSTEGTLNEQSLICVGPCSTVLLIEMIRATISAPSSSVDNRSSLGSIFRKFERRGTWKRTFDWLQIALDDGWSWSRSPARERQPTWGTVFWEGETSEVWTRINAMNEQ